MTVLTGIEQLRPAQPSSITEIMPAGLVPERVDPVTHMSFYHWPVRFPAAMRAPPAVLLSVSALDGTIGGEASQILYSVKPLEITSSGFIIELQAPAAALLRRHRLSHGRQLDSAGRKLTPYPRGHA